MTVCAFQLDHRGESFVTGELKCANPFGQSLFRFAKFSKGRFFAPAPERLRGDPYAFHTSIHAQGAKAQFPVPRGYVQEVPTTDAALASRLGALLARDSDLVLISESYLLRAGDLSVVTALPKRTATCGDFVYHLSLHGDTDSEIEAVVRSMYAVPLGLGVLVSLSPERVAEAAHCTRFHKRDLTQFAERAKAIFVGAYDGESVVAWISAELEPSLPSCANASRDNPV